MWRGWSVNLSMPGLEHTFEVQMPVPPMFETSQGAVLELVFWTPAVERWVHAVSQHHNQPLPQGHVQVALGDMEWVRYHIQHGGRDALIWAIKKLEEYQRGVHAPPAY